MRLLLILLLSGLSGCRSKDERLRAEYFAALEVQSAAYAGADAAKAFEQTLLFIDRVRKLEAKGASIPAKDIFIWDVARLGLLAEQLGRHEEAARYFSLAAENSRRAYGDTSGMNEAQLRAALEQMDKPDKFPWRAK